MRQWRLIDDQPAPGAWNMAVDMAILEAVAAGESLPTLRLYAWNPACLSLGYGQRIADVDHERLLERGWDIVRRPTGGRAILHTDELTYSVALPVADDLAAGTVVESYRRLSRALMSGLEYLGAQLESKPAAQAAGYHLGPVCFETPSHYEITWAGRKLVGSAQVRRAGGVLQHGSVPLVGDIGRIVDALAYPDEHEREAARAQVRARATSLTEALGQDVFFSQVSAALVMGFQSALQVDFVETAAQPTVSEIARARQLHAEFFAHPPWTSRR
ncbi:MAG: lipoate--protein ligase family protein [Anaerolineae bacterium]|nr:lipoate--protein ligase family protein [Anaerolineae bacterium]